VTERILVVSLVMNLFLGAISLSEVHLPTHGIAKYHYHQIKWFYLRGCLHGAGDGISRGWSKNSKAFKCETGKKEFEELFLQSYDKIYDMGLKIYGEPK